MSSKDLEELCFQEGLCLRCLEPGHRMWTCNAGKEKISGVKDCQRKHHRMLHKETRTFGNKKPDREKQWKPKQRTNTADVVKEVEEEEDSQTEEGLKSDKKKPSSPKPVGGR